MTLTQELFALCGRLTDSSIRIIPGYNSRSLIIDRAIGTISIPIDSNVGWRSDSMVTSIETTPWNLEKPFDDLLAIWQLAHPDEYSSTKIALSGFRNNRERDHLLELSFRRTSWSQVRAFQEAVERNTHEQLTTPLMKYHFDIWQCPIPNIAVIHAVVATKDNQIIATQRSQHVQYHSLAWSLSLEEGLKEADLSRGCDPIKAATVRAIAEELTGGASLWLDEFSILAIAVEFPILNPAIVTFARINLDSKALMSLWTNLVAGTKRPEVACLRFIPFELFETTDFFSQRGQSFGRGGNAMEILHPTSRYRLLLAMIHRFGLGRTIAAIAGRSRL